MTDREKAIVMAYTGITMLTDDKFNIFHKYVEDIIGKPIWTHEFGLLADEIKEKSKADFMALCEDESDSKKMEDVAKAFQIGLALGFGENHDEMDKVIDEIKKVITPQPKTRYWIIYDVHGHKACKCSECDKDVGYPCNYKYCPYCGIRIIESKELSE